MEQGATVATVISQAISLGLLSLAGVVLSRLLKIDVAITCVLIGAAIGLNLDRLEFDTGIRASNIDEIAFLIIMPVIVMTSAWQLQIRQFKSVLLPVLLLATGGIVVTALVGGSLIYWGIGHPAGFPWIAGALTGAILVSTDTGSVVEKIRQIGAPERLAALFEGEGLLNDAAAIVLYAVALSVALTGHESFAISESMTFFFQTLGGGLVIGVVGGLLAVLASMLARDPRTHLLTLMLMGLSSAYLAEVQYGVSGIVAVLVSTLVYRYWVARVDKDPSNPDGVESNLEWLALGLTAMLFVIMGLTITVEMFSQRWLAMLIAIPAALIGRLLCVSLCALLVYPTSARLPLSWSALLFWGGSRGAIPVALVLTLPVQLDYWWTIQSIVFGVVLFGLLIQVPSTGLMIRALVLKGAR